MSKSKSLVPIVLLCILTTSLLTFTLPNTAAGPSEISINIMSPGVPLHEPCYQTGTPDPTVLYGPQLGPYACTHPARLPPYDHSDYFSGAIFTEATDWENEGGGTEASPTGMYAIAIPEKVADSTDRTYKLYCITYPAEVSVERHHYPVVLTTSTGFDMYWILIIDPPSGQVGHIEVYYGRAGPKIDVLRMPVIRQPDAALIAMQTGTADVSTDLIRTGDIEKLDADGHTITFATGFHTGHIGYNIRPLEIQQERRPELTCWPLADVKFRKALFQCYDQESIVASIYGYTVTPVTSLVPPAQGGWRNPSVAKPPYNPGDPIMATPGDGTACGTLLTAGYVFVDAGTVGVVDQPDYWECPNGDPVPFMALWTPTYETAPTSADHGARFVADLDEIGLAAIDIGDSGMYHEPREFEDYMDDVDYALFDAYMVFWRLGKFPDHLYDMCHSSQDVYYSPGRHNKPGICDPELDANVEKLALGKKVHEEKVAKIVDSTGGTTFHYLLVQGPGHTEDLAQKMADAVSKWRQGPGSTSKVLTGAEATKAKIKAEIDKWKDKAKPGDEFVLYLRSHGGDKHVADTDKDEPKGNGFDNCIKVAENKLLSDDELTKWLSGFKRSVSIVVMIQTCYSGTWTDGKRDLGTITAADGKPVDQGDLAVLMPAKTKSPSGAFTRRLLEGLEDDGTGHTKADKNKDDVTTAKEAFDHAFKKIEEFYSGDNDEDESLNEDDVEYDQDQMEYLLIDNDGDGLIDEDPWPWEDTYLEQTYNHQAILAAGYKAQNILYNESYPNAAFSYMQLYSSIYFNGFNEDLTGIVDSPGYGSNNRWTHLNMHWTPGTERYTEDGKTLINWILGEPPETLNPLSAGTEYAWEIMDRVYDPLTIVNPYTHEDLPWLATDWAGGMTVIFYLREDVFWQDGNPYTAYDAKFNWMFLKDNEIPRYSSMWEYIVDVSVAGPYTVVVNLNASSMFLLYDLANTATLLPPPVWEPYDGQPLETILAYDPSTDTTPKAGMGPWFGAGQGHPSTCLYGTGPFVFEYWDPVGMVVELRQSVTYFETSEKMQEQLEDMFYGCGDVNRDGTVWADDRGQMGLLFGMMQGIDPEYDPDVDVNKDGIIDMGDITVANYFFGKQKEYP